MKRSEIESRVSVLVADVKQRIEAAPLLSFASGVLIGVILATFARGLIPLIFFIAIVGAAVWFFAEEDGANTPGNPPPF